MTQKLTATLGVTLLLTLGLRAQAPQQPPAGQPQAQTPAADQGPMAKEKFKNIKVLNIPASQLRDTMEYFTAALGTNCATCHVTGPQQDFAADDKRAKDTARKMIQMVDTFNANPDKVVTLTCVTCHDGHQQPSRTPPLAVEMTPAEAAAAAQMRAQFAAGGGPGGPGGPGGAPQGAPNGQGQRQGAPGGAPGAAPAGPGGPGGGRGQRPTETIDDVLSKYVQAIGGDQAVAAAKSRVIHGTATTRDLVATPVTIEEKTTGEYRIVLDSKPQPQTRVSDGKASWAVGGNGQARDLEGVQAAQVSRATEFGLPLTLKQHYQTVQVQRYGNIDGTDTIVVAARLNPDVTDTFQFARQSGLLLRKTTQTRTPYGSLQEQVDFSDYQTAGGVKMPYTVKYSSWNAATTTKYTDVKVNAPIDAADFAKK
jgi:hypothetical protein